MKDYHKYLKFIPLPLIAVKTEVRLACSETANKYMLKVDNRNITKRWKICLKLIIKTLELRP